MKVKASWLAFVAFVATVFGANWAINTFGVVPVAPGLVAPAGVFFAGVAFSVRDWLHECGGKRWVVCAILVGACASVVVSPQFAVASGAAFLLSETLDFLVYAPLHRHTRYGAVLLSNTVGAVVDSVVFLWLAFGSLEFVAGQVVGKIEMTALTLLVLAAYTHVRNNTVLPQSTELHY